jgi:hypothetical protein
VPPSFAKRSILESLKLSIEAEPNPDDCYDKNQGVFKELHAVLNEKSQVFEKQLEREMEQEVSEDHVQLTL